MKILNESVVTECNIELIEKLFASVIILFFLGVIFICLEKIISVIAVAIVDTVLLFMLIFIPFITDGYYIKNQYEIILSNDYSSEEIEKLYENYDVYICDEGKWIITDKEWVKAK